MIRWLCARHGPAPEGRGGYIHIGSAELKPAAIGLLSSDFRLICLVCAPAVSCRLSTLFTVADQHISQNPTSFPSSTRIPRSRILALLPPVQRRGLASPCSSWLRTLLISLALAARPRRRRRRMSTTNETNLKSTLSCQPWTAVFSRASTLPCCRAARLPRLSTTANLRAAISASRPPAMISLFPVWPESCAPGVPL